ncbi:MAG: phosphate acyltransferase PlsX [Planctomycetota bacterium]|jgi:glycerol-3-phosphate acyltransferase PlsX
MRIAVDAMGGDRAPEQVVKGALEAAARFDDVEIFLAGVPEKIGPLLPKEASSRIRTVACSEVVAMHEPPVEAIRRKRDSSLRRVFELAASKEADAVVSAGNTGATVAAASLLIKPLEGCRRPGIAARVPSREGHTLVIDVGANIAPRPVHFLQYAVMAQIFAREFLGVAQPSVGILSVGEEREKGTELVKSAHTLFSRHVSGFIGNAEGRDIFTGDFNVIVCDGFTGNVLIKALEGYAEFLVGTLVDNIARELPADHDRLENIISHFVAANDYREYGGAPLLGVESPVIICHGSSNSTAIANAIGVARGVTNKHVNDLIVDALRNLDVPGQVEVSSE